MPRGTQEPLIRAKFNADGNILIETTVINPWGGTKVSLKTITTREAKDEGIELNNLSDTWYVVRGNPLNIPPKLRDADSLPKSDSDSPASYLTAEDNRTGQSPDDITLGD